jgi:hypothetical protein
VCVGKWNTACRGRWILNKAAHEVVLAILASGVRCKSSICQRETTKAAAPTGLTWRECIHFTNNFYLCPFLPSIDHPAISSHFPVVSFNLLVLTVRIVLIIVDVIDVHICLWLWEGAEQDIRDVLENMPSADHGIHRLLCSCVLLQLVAELNCICLVADLTSALAYIITHAWNISTN